MLPKPAPGRPVWTVRERPDEQASAGDRFPRPGQRDRKRLRCGTVSDRPAFHRNARKYGPERTRGCLFAKLLPQLSAKLPQATQGIKSVNSLCSVLPIGTYVRVQATVNMATALPVFVKRISGSRAKLPNNCTEFIPSRLRLFVDLDDQVFQDFVADFQNAVDFFDRSRICFKVDQHIVAVGLFLDRVS